MFGPCKTYGIVFIVMRKLINIFEETVIDQARKDKIKTIDLITDGDLDFASIHWKEEDGNLVAFPNIVFKLDEYRIPENIYDIAMKTLVRSLMKRGVNPEDGITFGNPSLSIMFGPERYQLTLTYYINNSTRIFLQSERPTFQDVLDGHFTRVSQDIPQLEPGFESHVKVKYQRLDASLKIFSKGKFEGEPYELEITYKTPLQNFTEYKPTDKVIHPDFTTVVKYKVKGNPNPSEELQDHINNQFKKLKIDASLSSL